LDDPVTKVSLFPFHNLPPELPVFVVIISPFDNFGQYATFTVNDKAGRGMVSEGRQIRRQARGVE
jgi:hypothetical protein